MKPTFSIIVPVYNVEKYLNRCIDSILSQSFKDFEVLLIDDGSTDKSGEICDEYAQKDERIRVFHKENGGVSSARNLGLDNARGEWIAFCDSDDDLRIDALNIYNDASNQSNGDLLVFGHDVLTEDGSVLCRTEYKADSMISSDYIKRILRYKTESSPWGKLYRTSLTKSLTFNENLKIGEDLLFNIEYALKCKSVVIFQGAVYNYYIHPVSALNNPNIINEYKKMSNVVSRIFKENHLADDYENELTAFAIVNVIQPLTRLKQTPNKEQVEFLKTYKRNQTKLLSDVVGKYMNLFFISSVLANIYLRVLYQNRSIKRYIKSFFKKISSL